MAGPQGGGKEGFVRAYGDGVFLHILTADVDRRTHGKAQSLPLAQGVAHGTPVRAYHLAAFIQKIAGLIALSRVMLHKGHVISVGHKTDVLGVLLPGIDEALLPGNGPGLLLGEIAKGKQCPGQLLLGQAVEHIALVLGRIRCLAQKPAAPIFVIADPGIVAGDDLITAQNLCLPEKIVKFQVAVAVDAGVGCQSGLVAADEITDYMLCKGTLGIEYIEGHAHFSGYGTGILRIVERAAAAVAAGKNIAVKHTHHGAGAVIACLTGQPGGCGAVHTAGHGNQSFHCVIASFFGSIAVKNRKVNRIPEEKSVKSNENVTKWEIRVETGREI